MKKITIFAAGFVIFITLSAVPSFTMVDAQELRLQPPTPQTQVQTLTMRVTAYSSSPEETDDTPFTTAAGTHVRDGVVATNMLPFGTKIKIPKLFGEKVFTVEDRMNRRMKNVLDVWMSSKKAAIRFGVSNAEVVIVGTAGDVALARK